MSESADYGILVQGGYLQNFQSTALRRKTMSRIRDFICDAIWHHDDKESIDSPFAEILKDADVIDHCLTDPTNEIKEKERSRYEKLCLEFRLTEAAE